MRRSSERPGEGAAFEEYFDQIPETIASGQHRGVDYRIHIRYRGEDTSTAKSHYTAYIRVPEICTHMISNHSVPPSPGHHGTNFGPTTDGWIGFGTVDDRDYNYDEEMSAFGADRRIDPNHLFEDDTINHFTPEVIEDAVLDWIDRVQDWQEDSPMGCQACESG